MKHRVVFLTSLILCVAGVLLCGCSGDTVSNTDVTYYDGETTVTIDKTAIADAVSEGRLALQYADVSETDVTADVVLKMSSEDLQNAVREADLERQEGERYIRYACGSAYFYYTNDTNTNGLAAVVSFGMVFGFEPGVTTKAQVEKVLGKVEAKPASEDAQAMFLFFAPDVTYTDYTFGQNHVSFYFDNTGVLTATVLYQDGLWID